MNKRRIVVYSVEAAIAFILFIMLLMPKKSYDFTAEECELVSGSIGGDGTAHIDEGDGRGVMLTTPHMNMGMGTYEAVVRYVTDTDNNMFYITLPKLMDSQESVNGRFKTDTRLLGNSHKSAKAEMLVKVKSSEYMMAVFYMGQGSLDIYGISVRQTNGWILRLIVIYAAVICCVNGCMWVYGRLKVGKLDEEGVKTGFFLGAAVIFASLPLMLPYMINGHDLSFHLLRIEGLKEGLLMGDFPVRIQPNWLDGNGYAASVFYGDIFLYIPALLRLCGYTVTEAYNIYVFLINLATCLIAYCCFKKMTGSRRAALLGAVLYTLSFYRIVNIYVRSAVGEYSAMTFLPLIACGMWKIFSEPTDTKDYRSNWIIPTIGFTGIINTHILTCEMTAAFIILLCLVFIKKVFRKETFIVLVKIVIFTCIVNIGFLVPFFDYMSRGGFVVTARERFAAGIQQYGSYLGQLLVPFAWDSGLAYPADAGMAGDFASTAGLSLIAGAVIAVYMLVMGHIKEKRNKVCIWICVAFGGLSLFMSTHLFPWDMFQKMNSLFNTLISMISMPWRFLTIASVVLTVAVVMTAADTENAEKPVNVGGIVIVLAAVCLIQSGVMMSGLMNDKEAFFVNYGYALDDCDLIGGEYLPFKGPRINYLKQYSSASDNLIYEEKYRRNTEVEFDVSNPSGDVGEVKLSMVYYEGYVARDTATGKRLLVAPTEEMMVGIRIAPGYQGSVRVSFEGFWYWKVAAGISGLCVILFTIFYVVKPRSGGVLIKNVGTENEGNADAENVDAENADTENNDI